MSLQEYRQTLELGHLLSEKQISNICATMKSILIQEANVIEANSPALVFGDLHGQFYDMLKVLRLCHPEKQPLVDKGKQYIFLGDYVDRGYHSIQTICYLFCLKCLHPWNLILLRGNHQTSSLTRMYGFYDQVKKKYGNHRIWTEITEVFAYLPLAAYVHGESQTLFCVHGGLSPKLPFISDIQQLDRFGDIPQEGPISDLLWSDPDIASTQSVKSIDKNPNANKGFLISCRGAGFIYTHGVVKEFNYHNQITTIVRAHQLVDQGYTYNFLDQSLVTVWSAPNYCYRCGNQASVMEFENHGGKQEHTRGMKHMRLFSSCELTQKNQIHYDFILPYFL